MAPTSPARQTLLSLTRLYSDELALLRGMRRARWLAWSVALVAVVLMLARLGAEAEVVVTAIEALGWLSWLVGGAITWSAVRNWRTFQEPLADMARERGIATLWRDIAAPLALARCISVAIGLPALLLTALAFALTGGTMVLWLYPALLLAVPSYVLLFAVGLGLLVLVSTKLSPDASGTALLFILVIPHLFRELWPYTPSVIGFYQWLWGELVYLGANA